ALDERYVGRVGGLRPGPADNRTWSYRRGRKEMPAIDQLHRTPPDSCMETDAQSAAQARLRQFVGLGSMEQNTQSALSATRMVEYSLAYGLNRMAIGRVSCSRELGVAGE